MDTVSEDLGPCKDTHTPDAVDLHFHVGITVRVAQIRKMRSPGRILRVALDNDRILVQCVGQSQSGLGFLPRIEIIRLLSAKPIRQGAPDICQFESVCD